jgi:hypothetical protein
MRRLLLSLLLAAPQVIAQERLFDRDDLDGRTTAARALGDLLAGSADLPTTIGKASSAATSLPIGSAARLRADEALAAAAKAPAAEADEALARLRLSLGDLVETLSFRPLRQAELPKGFPDFQAVDEIELRQYPAYRMVRTSMKGGSNRAFWPLFRHIESNGIAMTTPVQMDWQQTGQGDGGRPVLMAFLYGDPQIEPKQTADGVEVVEAPAATVLSIGAIGDDRRERVEQLRARLEAFVAASAGRWQACGPLRTMGYNSPMVSRDRRYFEVQLPIRQAEPAPKSEVR